MKQTNRRKQDIRYIKENRIKHITLYLLINQTNNYHIIDNKEAKKKEKRKSTSHSNDNNKDVKN